MIRQSGKLIDMDKSDTDHDSLYTELENTHTFYVVYSYCGLNTFLLFL